jgi:ATP-dependent HslUV protease subunit HslV
MATFASTTVLLVRRDGRVCMASDGQVTVGFAGGGADALALFTRLEAKLEEFGGNLERAVVELAKEWRTDRALRQLQAMILVTDRERSYLVSGTGELLSPDEDDATLAIGSGAHYALAAARALLRHTDLPAAEVVRESMKIASEICIFTNDRLTLEEL